MLGEFGEAHLLDWGLAQRIFKDGSITPLSIVGTPMYISPEQARGNALNSRSDVYALGATLYELLTGQAAFEGSDEEMDIPSILSRVQAGRFDKPSDRKGDVAGESNETAHCAYLRVTNLRIDNAMLDRENTAILCGTVAVGVLSAIKSDTVRLGIVSLAVAGFRAIANERQFISHYHRWFAATPNGPISWDGADPLLLRPGERYFVVVGAVFQGKCAISKRSAVFCSRLSSHCQHVPVR